MQIKGVAEIYSGSVVNKNKALEVAASNCFVESYNKAHGTHFEIKEYPDRPDLLIGDSSTGEMMGVEVTHLFYDQKEPQMLLGKVPLDPQSDNEKFFYVLAGKLNALLGKKVEVAFKYNFCGKLFLLICVACPAFNKSHFEMYPDWIDLNLGNPFAEVWLLFYNESTEAYSDLLQIQ